MKHRLLFAAAILGVLAGIGSAVYYSLPRHAQPPVFSPPANPFASGIYANGIVESAQPSGSNVDIFAEVSAPVAAILVKEGATVSKGAPLVSLDDSVQRATVAQLEQQAAAARALLEELKAQPRAENLRIAEAQVAAATASYKSAEDQYDKQKRSFDIDPGSVSRDALDNASNAAQVARAALELARRQYELTRAGAWSYDIAQQEGQYRAFAASADAARALLAKYVIRAPTDGVVLAVNTAVGSYVSPQGAYSSYTQSNGPVVVMGAPQEDLDVRVYVDEILVNRIPPEGQIRAEMAVRGTDVRIPLQFVRMQPYLAPKIQLSDQRQERVDVRVLPLIFRFGNTGKAKLYPGQLVDVYIATKAGSR
ncbi:MAG TPA: biotin/lipoyl-binding protein [Usitatibacter sp.]|nr:biotin/lipoyl-binding protein [Usitatibacter sp.]